MGEGDIALQYQLVLLLRLREERISNAKSLEDLIYHPLKDVHQAVCHELVLAHDFHALIILEGFDELPDRCRTYFMDLIAGKLLPLATVLVTSRPWATERIRLSYGNRISQHIEILGFTGRQITEYIESTLPPEKVSDLKAYLVSHPQIRAGMYIPLNSAIVVTVYEESQAGGCAMPATLTELYTSLTLTLLVRYLRGHPEYGTDCKYLQTLKDLPQRANEKFCEVCKLAYNGTIGTSGQVQLIFRDLPSDFDDLGFMDSVTELYVTRGAFLSHNFLHLTFQEFFAAVHISNMSPEEQVEHFKRHKEGSLKVVLRFLAGLNKLNCFSIEEIASNFFQTPSKREGSRYLISCNAAVGIDLVQWLFEAQSDDVIEHVLGQKTIEFELSSRMLPLDYYSLGYCISHSQCQWVLGLGEEGIDETGAKMLAAGAGTRSGSSRVVGVSEGTASFLANNLHRIVAESNSIISHQLSLKLSGKCDADPITCSDLSALQVLELIISGKNRLKLNALLPHLSLESLNLSPASNDSSLVYEDCVAIGDHITSTISLKELCISSDINSDKKGVEAITAALANNQSLPLERLELECECTFTATAVDSLAQFTTNTTTLKYLSIKEGNFDRVETLTAALASNQSLPLERLELECKCTFTATAGDSLAQFITNTTTLKYLSIKECSFSAHALLVLARAIHHNSILQTKNVDKFSFTVNGDNDAKGLAQLLVEYLDLVNKIGPDRSRFITCKEISDAGALALAQALHHNSTLTDLYLSNNSISDAGAVALAEALHHNSTLTQLDLSNNSISDAGAVALAQALHHNSTLTQLYLSNNSISDAGAVALAEALHHNSTLTQLYLYNNSISDAGAVALAEALHHNSTMTELDLSNNSISYAGAVALAQALHHNSTLTWLNLSKNSISYAGAVDLGQALHHNSTLTLLV